MRGTPWDGTRCLGYALAVRVTAIASLTPLEELDADPFLVDSRSQHAMCARWAAERGYVVTRELLVRGLRARPLRAVGRRPAGASTCSSRPAAGCWRARCPRSRSSPPSARGAGCGWRRWARRTRYDAQMKASVHRRLSMPTAGYDGR